jgi:hypothetical protein
MQALQTDAKHANYVREALKELLTWEPTEREALVFLNAILRFHATPEARLDTWSQLVELYQVHQGLLGGADPGFDDLGDGLYIQVDRETGLQRAESELEDALDAAVGLLQGRPLAA